MYFHFFTINSFGKRKSTFIWKHLNPLYPSAMFGWNWPMQLFLRRIWKAYRQRTDGHTIYEEQKRIRLAHLSFKLIDRWAKKICKQILWQTSFDKSKRSMINKIFQYSDLYSINCLLTRHSERHEDLLSRVWMNNCLKGDKHEKLMNIYLFADF